MVDDETGEQIMATSGIVAEAAALSDDDRSRKDMEISSHAVEVLPLAPPPNLGGGSDVTVDNHNGGGISGGGIIRAI